ncbi:hypothetical protein [Rhizobium laguerreae]|uniref:hypothetical protein n=1 Tax=Rhizobium laguerreae TaxID=1076926 RepID=UPI00197DB04E
MPLFQAMLVAIECAGFGGPWTFKHTGGVSKLGRKLINGMIANGFEREFAEKTFGQCDFYLPISIEAIS